MKFTREQMLEQMEVLMKERYNITRKDLRKYLQAKGKKGTLLTDKEKRLIDKKFGFNSGEIMTLKEISEEEKCSISHVSKQIHIAFTKIYANKF